MRANKEFLYQVGLALKPFARVAKSMRNERRRTIDRRDKLLISDFERAQRMLEQLDDLTKAAE
jgi:hypothetical protein